MRNKILLVAGIVFAAGLMAVIVNRGNAPETQYGTSPNASKADWLTDFKIAQEKAQAQNKPLLVDFTGSDWCPPCIMLEKQVFSQPEFAEYAVKNVVLVKIDFPRRKPLPEAQQAANDALAQRYGIRGFPTILVLDPAGTVKGQLGYMLGGPAKFTAKIEEILGKS